MPGANGKHTDKIRVQSLSCISYYTSSVLPDICAVFSSLTASGSSYMHSPVSLSFRHPTGKVPFARLLTCAIREVGTRSSPRTKVFLTGGF